MSATVANDGVLMQATWCRGDGAGLSAVRNATQSLSTAVTPTQAAHLQTMMTSVVQGQSAPLTPPPELRSPGDQIAGKTGTARNGINNSGLDDAVFTVMRRPPTRDRRRRRVRAAVADAAAPIAVAIIKAYLNSQGKG